MKGFILKIFVLLALLLSVFYFFFLRPKYNQNKLEGAQNTLSLHHSNLLQNRLSFIELTKLDSNSATYNFDKLNLIGILQESNQKGLKDLGDHFEIPDIDKELSERSSGLMIETRDAYEKQNILLEKVFATTSYEEGIKILRSGESVSILTDQTNLLLELEYYLTRLKGLQ